MKKNVLYSIIVLFLLVKHTYAQDIHFSQYYLSPLSLNPANTGNYKGDYRFFGNYRSQWRDISGAYKTFSAGGDLNFFPGNVNLSAGLIFISDKSGGNLSVTKILPSFAFHKKILGFKLSAGIQAGVVFKSIDLNAHSFPNQLNWNVGGFDKGLPNGENGGQNEKYFDLNLGGAVAKKFGKFEPEIGIAFFHLNKPKESLLGNDGNRLPVRQAYNLGVGYYVTPVVIVKLHSIYGYTNRVSDWVSGVNLEYVLSRDAFFSNSVFAGFMWRNGVGRNSDAGIMTAGLNYSHYTIGFSYDVTISKLKTSVDSKGAYEIAFIYRGKNTRLTRKAVPCERY